jgi:extradiol dioxygenase family protein
LIKRVSWLEIKVTDVKTDIGFYRDVLGLKTKNEWSNYVIFDLLPLEEVRRKIDENFEHTRWDSV